jgi:hypothetical protein
MSKNEKYTAITRRSLLSLAAAAPLAGCDTKPYGMSWGDWGDLIGTAAGLKAGPAISRQQAANIPYATIGFRLGDSSEAVLLLAEKTPDGSLWTSINRQAIVTAKGRIRETAGFHWNLNSTNFVEDDPVGTVRLTTNLSGQFNRICDFTDISRFQTAIAAHFEIQGEETVTILESDLKTIRVAENCRCEALNWNFENYYWIDRDSGFVWRTVQTVHPNQEPFTVEILRPEA